MGHLEVGLRSPSVSMFSAPTGRVWKAPTSRSTESRNDAKGRELLLALDVLLYFKALGRASAILSIAKAQGCGDVARWVFVVTTILDRSQMYCLLKIAHFGSEKARLFFSPAQLSPISVEISDSTHCCAR